ncbi:MAG: ethanolamine utilization protein EutH, partial [Planctomycetaceae bacterium]
MHNLVTWIIMACAVAGALAAIRDAERGLGKQFMEGLYSIGPIFVPVAGIMAAVPYLAYFTDQLLGPAFDRIGADPAVAATSVIAVDMGGYKLAESLAHSTEGWIVAMVVGYMAGATVIFSIPVGLAMVERSDHKYLALGILSGILSVPIGVATTGCLLILSPPMVRSTITSSGVADYRLALTFNELGWNLIPLLAFVLLIAGGLRCFPDLMIRLFLIFGRLVDAAIKLILVACIVEYFTEACSWLLSCWGATWHFAPIIADQNDQFRALETAGYIGIMLAGAFPMVYLIQKYLSGAIRRCGARIGLSETGAAGMLATSANVLAMFRLIKDMPARDKVLNVAFAVCGAFLFGDHLAFSANFQPTL